MDWQPIETAPKDGTPVLLFWSGIKKVPVWGLIRFTVGKWKADHPVPHWEPTDAAFMHVLHPQYWMPLPAPPA